MKIPGWLGPIIGAVLGGVIYFKIVLQGNSEPDWGICALAVGMGAAAGCIMLLLDLGRKKKKD